MPNGIVATVDGAYATIDFVDVALRGPALAALLEIGGPDSIETITRRGPRRQYRVLTGNAEAADLLDGDEVARVASAGQDTGNAAALVSANPLTLDVVVTITATGGSWKYTYGGQPTAAVAATVSASALQTAIVALSNVVGGEVAVVQIATKVFAIHHTNRAPVSVASDTTTPLTGGTVSVAGPTGDDGADWHTPVDEYTSANSYVGHTTSAQERAMTPPRFTGTATPFGGSSAADTPTHAEVIAHVKTQSHNLAVGGVLPPSERAQERMGAVVRDTHPGAMANLRLSTQESARGDDPGASPVRDTPFVDSANAPVADPTDPDSVEQPTGLLGAPQGYPEGDPQTDWKRTELDAYAAASPREINTTDLPNKQAVLDAIAARNEELKK